MPEEYGVLCNRLMFKTLKDEYQLAKIAIYDNFSQKKNA